MVPVIRSVEGMNFADIEKAINLLGEKVIFIFHIMTHFKSYVCRTCSFFVFLKLL